MALTCYPPDHSLSNLGLGFGGALESWHRRGCVSAHLARRFLTAQRSAFAQKVSTLQETLVSKRSNGPKAFCLWFQYLYLKPQYS